MIRSLFPERVVERAREIARGSVPIAANPRLEDSKLRSLNLRFGSEERCRAYLERLRWPNGVVCPRCGRDEGISRIQKRGQFDCRSCGYQFSVRVGTVFQNSHLPLTKWLLAAYIMGESQRGVPANRLKVFLGIPYKTAWYLCHRIRAAMKDEASEPVRLITDVPTGRSHVSAKHLPKYLDEMAFRSSNRLNRYRFREILLRLIRAESVPYMELIATA